MTTTILTGDCRSTLKTLSPGSVQCVVTSPPYWGLRAYLPDDSPLKNAEVGLEETPDEYVSHLVEVFREVKRVIRDDGVAWLNLGDSYARDPAKGGTGTPNGRNDPKMGYTGSKPIPPGLRPKDLAGIPWKVAFAIQADGWYLRQDVIWSKGNCMPEAVIDRCTRSHEYLFMFTMNPSYFYDADAIREPSTGQTGAAAGFIRRSGTRNSLIPPGQAASQHRDDRDDPTDTGTRNKRSVWSVNSRPYEGAHFAVMPPALVEPCILAGSRQGDTVLDPFGGSGTVGMVANWHNRDSILCELNPGYVKLIEERVKMDRTETGGWKPSVSVEASMDLLGEL